MTEDRIALVTGAARGIGLGAAKALAVHHRVVLVDRDGAGARRAIARRTKMRGAHWRMRASSSAPGPLKKLGGNCSALRWQAAHQA